MHSYHSANSVGGFPFLQWNVLTSILSCSVCNFFFFFLLNHPLEAMREKNFLVVHPFLYTVPKSELESVLL